MNRDEIRAMEQSIRDTEARNELFAQALEDRRHGPRRRRPADRDARLREIASILIGILIGFGMAAAFVLALERNDYPRPAGYEIPADIELPATTEEHQP